MTTCLQVYIAAISQVLPAMQVENYSLWRLRDRPGQKSLAGFAAQKTSRSAVDDISPAVAWATEGDREPVPSSLHDGSRKPVLTLDFAGILRAFVKDTQNRHTQGERSTPTNNVPPGPPTSLQSLVDRAKLLSAGQTSFYSTENVEMERQGRGTETGHLTSDIPDRFEPAHQGSVRHTVGEEGDRDCSISQQEHVEGSSGVLHAHECSQKDSGATAPQQDVAAPVLDNDAAQDATGHPDGSAGTGNGIEKRRAAATRCDTEHDSPQNDRAAQDKIEEAKDRSLRAAHQIAAQARQRCDMLKGPPRSSREDPDFQANYFAASRLHFIGSWKARIEALAVSMANDAPKASVPARGSSRAIIHIDMDCFFASVAGDSLSTSCSGHLPMQHSARRCYSRSILDHRVCLSPSFLVFKKVCAAALGEPALQGKPLCVSHSASSKGAGEVSSANYEARAFGVGAGMFISEAKRLCPDIIVMPYFFEKYEAISEKVQWLFGSPVMGIMQYCAPLYEWIVSDVGR